MRVQPHAPRHIPARTDLRVAVVPFGDSRGFEQEGISWWLLAPLVPWSTGAAERPEETEVNTDHADHFRLQVPRVLAQYLHHAGLFGRVAYLPNGTADPEEWDLVITGEVARCRRDEMRTLYGLSAGGVALWFLGAPMGYDRVGWELKLALRDARSGAALKRVHHSHAETRWKGLYWGADGFPDDEAELLRQVFASVAADLDGALNTVAELQTMTARPMLSRSAPATPPQHVSSPAASGLSARTIVILPAEVDPAQPREAFVELLAQELQAQSQAQVLGRADLNALLAWERLRDLMGCADPQCLSSLGNELEADLVVSVSFDRLGTRQTVSIKAIAPGNRQVVSRTTWEASGSEPSPFVPRLPQIVRTLLEPVLASRGL
jgi:hypothetical protein